MKHTYHVYTPFCRFQNLERFTSLLKPMGVQWHPIFDDDLNFSITGDWINPLYCIRKATGWESHMGHFKGNWFFDHAIIIPGHRYINLNDDDMVEPGFFDKLDQYEGHTLVVTALRGHSQPASGPQYGTSTLEAKPECIEPGLISGEQLIFDGRVLGSDRYDQEAMGDGRFVKRMCARTPPVFVPEAHIWFNYLEPGRWNQ